MTTATPVHGLYSLPAVAGWPTNAFLAAAAMSEPNSPVLAWGKEASNSGVATQKTALSFPPSPTPLPPPLVPSLGLKYPASIYREPWTRRYSGGWRRRRPRTCVPGGERRVGAAKPCTAAPHPQL